MKINIQCHIQPASEIVKSLGLEEGGRVQTIFTNEVREWSEPYVPMDNGLLKNNTSMAADGTSYTYESPYAHYQYVGDLYVDPKYLKGAFFNPHFGYWSRPGIPKVRDPNGKKINNWNGKRGPYWVERMWADNGKNICRELENDIRSGRA